MKFFHPKEKVSNQEKKSQIKQIETILARLCLIFTIVLWFALILRPIAQAYEFDPTVDHFFEHTLNVISESIIRGILPVLGAYLTFKHNLLKYGKVSAFRVISLIGLALTNFILLVIIPSTFGLFRGFNHVTMPFPFISEVYQIPNSGMIYSENFVEIFGPNGPKYAITLHLIFQILAFGGSFLFGRRAFCSTLCAYAGPFAENLGEGFPIKPQIPNRPKSKAMGPKFQKFAKIMLVLDVGIALFVAIPVLIWVFSGIQILNVESLLELEFWRIILLDTVLFGIGFLIWGGRFYCYYCPAGLFMGMMGRLGGQQLETNRSKCISCGKCNDACKMSIDILSFAQKGEPVKTWRCVGCDSCVMACPTSNLRFTTRFTRLYLNKKEE